jgi:hypothetical protein
VRSCLAIGVLAVVAPSVAGAGEPIPLMPVSLSYPHATDLDAFPPDNTLLLSVNYPLGNPNTFSRLLPDNTLVPWAPGVSGIPEEVSFAVSRGGPGTPFPVGTVFFSTGTVGRIGRIAPDGTVTGAWVQVPPPISLFRGDLVVDDTGAFGGDLVAVDKDGRLVRVDGSGGVTRLATLAFDTQNVVTVPVDPRYGLLSGTAIVWGTTNGVQSTLAAVTPAGFVRTWTLPFGQPEVIVRIPENENFYGLAYSQGLVIGAPAAAFDGLEGELLLVEQFPSSGSGLHLLQWDAATSAPVTRPLSVAGPTITHWEHVAFAPAGTLQVATPVVPGPTPATRLVHQGRIFTTAGTPWGGPSDLRVRLWRSATSDDPEQLAFDETFAAVPLDDGVYTLLLGADPARPLPADLSGDLWVGVAVAEGPEWLRQPLRAAPRAAAVEGGRAVPAGLTAWFPAACPPGFAEATDARGRTVVAVPASGSVGGVLGAALADGGGRPLTDVPRHTHQMNPAPATTSSQTHSHDYSDYYWQDTGDTDLYGTPGGDGVGNRVEVTRTTAAATDGHTVDLPPMTTSSAGSASVDVSMPYVQLVACRAL